MLLSPLSLNSSDSGLGSINGFKMLLFRLPLYLPKKVSISNPRLSDVDNRILRDPSFPLPFNSASNSLIGDLLVLIFAS